MRNYYTLGQLVKVLGLKPHIITYALTARHLPEPAVRVGNKRVFTGEDVERAARHFGVSAKWDALREHSEDVGHPAGIGPTYSLKGPFTVESVDAARHEVRGGEGAVYCWTEDRGGALVIAGLLESAGRG